MLPWNLLAKGFTDLGSATVGSSPGEGARGAGRERGRQGGRARGRQERAGQAGRRGGGAGRALAGTGTQRGAPASHSTTFWPLGSSLACARTTPLPRAACPCPPAGLKWSERGSYCQNIKNVDDQPPYDPREQYRNYECVMGLNTIYGEGTLEWVCWHSYRVAQLLAGYSQGAGWRRAVSCRPSFASVHSNFEILRHGSMRLSALIPTRSPPAGALIALWLGYFVLAIYFDNVVPNEFGVSR
jgi:hypothetical protein